MNKTKFIGWLVITILIVAGIFLFSGNERNKQNDIIMPPVQDDQTKFDGKNATYVIEGKSFTLVNGLAEEEAAPGSASKIITRYFGNEAKGDLNGDGFEDSALLITQEGGGSGLFYFSKLCLGAS